MRNESQYENMQIFTNPNKEPKNPLDDVSFFCASAINACAFCSESPILMIRND